MNSQCNSNRAPMKMGSKPVLISALSAFGPMPFVPLGYSTQKTVSSSEGKEKSRGQSGLRGPLSIYTRGCAERL